MSGNIIVFWRPSADPPSPWTRLTRQGRYIRFTDAANLPNVWAQVGAATHRHGNTMSAASVGNSGSTVYAYSDNTPWDVLGDHNHPAPGSWSISSNDNNPAWYGLDIIYMDLTVWETYEKRFPDGAIVLSSEALSDPGFMERFTAADGKYIVNTTPGSTGGVTENKQHYCQGTTGSGAETGPSITIAGSRVPQHITHTHDIAAWSSGNTNEPRNLTTRLYEILALTTRAKTGVVVFCDAAPGANWEVLDGWANANLKSGDSNPSLSGADSHSQSISGNTGGSGLSNNRACVESQNVYATVAEHVHPFSATLAAENHIPPSSLLVPMKLLYNLVHNTAPNTPSTPTGTQLGNPNTSYTYSSAATDPEGNNVYLIFNWGDGSGETNTEWVVSGQLASANHSFASTGTYNVVAKAVDSGGLVSGWSAAFQVVINTSPNTPSTPSGPIALSRNASGSYSATTTDPNGDNIYYTFDWGDGQTTNTGWISSGQPGSASHVWTVPGTYSVKAKATDTAALVSGWSGNLTVTIKPIVGGAQLIGLCG